MIPKFFAKEHSYPHFSSFGVVPIPNVIVRSEFNQDSHNLAQSGVEIAPNANIESILQVHRRKMLRRAANRRSAQLSRARKKAHLEELKQENSRLQRLVDVLDSQPELVFCVTSLGRITYVSERTINFIKINYAAEDSDEDPTHINQILSKESADNLMEIVNKLQECSLAPSTDSDLLNMLFSVKEVYFHDAFGHPVVGFLRVSRVRRRTSLQDLQTSVCEKNEKANAAAALTNSSNNNSNNSSSTTTIGPPAAKKARGRNPYQTAGSSSNNHQQQHSSGSGGGGNSSDDSNNSSSMKMIGNGGAVGPNWNLSNFNILADYASNFTDDLHHGDANSCSSIALTQGDVPSVMENNNNSNNSSEPPEEYEYVCVVRTSDGCFAPYRSHRDLLMFSSGLSTASIEAHDLEMRSNGNNKLASAREKRPRGGSPNGSNHSTGQTNLSDSSNQLKNSTSSEAGSEDNSGEIDSN